MNTDDLTVALRNCTVGLLPLEAGTELLISNGTFCTATTSPEVDDLGAVAGLGR